jgi:hypothetical protein
LRIWEPAKFSRGCCWKNGKACRPKFIFPIPIRHFCAREIQELKDSFLCCFILFSSDHYPSCSYERVQLVRENLSEEDQPLQRFILPSNKRKKNLQNKKMPELYYSKANQFEEEKRESTTRRSGSFFTTGGVVKMLSYALAFCALLFVVSIVRTPVPQQESSVASLDRKTGTNTVAVGKAANTKNNLKGELDSLTFTLERDGYSALDYFDPTYDSQLNYLFLGDYTAIIEPGAAMKLSFYEFSSLSDDSVSYEYTICSNDDADQSCQQGSMYYDTNSKATVTSSVTFSCSPRSTYTMTVFEVSKEGSVLSSAFGQALCLYIRREIRSLTTADLNAFLDASYTMNTVDQETGEKQYGSNYYSALTLTKLHFYNSAQRDADHVHEGNGFLLQHAKLQNYFEASIQSVDQSVALPYWDFTIDFSEDKNGFDSFLSSPDVYGTLTYPQGSLQGFTKPENSVEDAQISDGRWQSLKAEMNTYFPDLYSGYGYMRAPWCFNPSPYVSRYAFDWDVQQSILPSCSHHYDILSITSEMMDFFYDMSFAPHASGHTVYGGVYGCDEIEYWVEMGLVKNTTMQQKACTVLMANMKILYRQGVIEVEKDCTVDEEDSDNSSCNFICRDEDSTETAAEFLYSAISKYFDLTMVTYEESITVLKDFICSTDSGLSKMFMGEHYESSSPADPSFWIMHPTLERLAHARFMSGGFADESWAIDGTEDFICMNSPCYHEDTDSTDFFTDCCYGHYENDQLYDGFTGTRSNYVGVANGALLTMSDPRTGEYTMDYIYDNFDWSHCLSEGYDFDALLALTYEEYLEENGLTDALEIMRAKRENKKSVAGSKKESLGKGKKDNNKVVTEKRLKDVKRYVTKKEKEQGKKSSHVQKSKRSRSPYEEKVAKRRATVIANNKKRYEVAKGLEAKRTKKGNSRSEWLVKYEKEKENKIKTKESKNQQKVEKKVSKKTTEVVTSMKKNTV